jgi:hypothetical protein
MIDAIEFVVAVGVVSAIIFVLTIRAENKAAVRARSRGGSSDVSTSASDSWGVASWIAYSSSTGTSAADSGSCTTGSWDSGGVSDCGSGAGGLGGSD